jgi:hypothetical protein
VDAAAIEARDVRVIVAEVTAAPGRLALLRCCNAKVRVARGSVGQRQALRVWSCAGLSPEHGRVAGGELGERGGSDAEPFVRLETHGRFGSFAPFAEQFVGALVSAIRGLLDEINGTRSTPSSAGPKVSGSSMSRPDEFHTRNSSRSRTWARLRTSALIGSPASRARPARSVVAAD